MQFFIQSMFHRYQKADDSSPQNWLYFNEIIGVISSISAHIGDLEGICSIVMDDKYYFSSK